MAALEAGRIDLPDVESEPVEKPAPPPRSRLDAFAAADSEDLPAPVPVATLPCSIWPSEGIALTDDELAGLFPPAHIIRILDAAVERELPDEVVESIIGKPLDDVTEEDEPEILRAIAEWGARGSEE